MSSGKGRAKTPASHAKASAKCTSRRRQQGDENDPWGAVSAKEIQDLLESAFVPVSDVPLKSSNVLLPYEPISIAGLLLDAASGDEVEAEQYREMLWDLGEQSLLARYLRRPPCWLVKCTSPGSMTSGMWGLGQFRMGRRGYIYFDNGLEDFGEEFNALPIFAAWEPVRSRKAFEACFVTTYERVWDDACLPPRMGERADGPSQLICEAIFNILVRTPEAWDEVGQAIMRALGVSTQRTAILDAAAHESGIPRPHLERIAKEWQGGAPTLRDASDRRALVTLFWKCIEGNPF